MQILIDNGIVIAGDRVIKGGSVLIEDNRILRVGDSNEVKKDVVEAEKIDASGKLVLPGFVNTHTHISMTLLRGYADDYPLQEWLNNWIWPIEAKLKPEDIELGAYLGALESIMMGVTTVCTLYHYHPDKNEASGILKAGIRGVVGIALFTWEKDKCIKNVKDALARWHGKNGLIRIAVGPHAPYTVDPDLWVEASELRKWGDEKYGEKGRVIITTHVAEDPNEAKITSQRFRVEIPGNAMFKYLDKLGVLDEYFLAAHAIHITSEDINIIKQRGVKISHNPISNMKLGMGISPIHKLLSNGIHVSLGTDGPASNNTLDIIETMKIATLLQKVLTGDPTVIPAKTAFKMATEFGAEALHMPYIGRICEEYLADIVIIDLHKPHLTPMYDPFSHIVYSMRSLDVNTVIVDGKILFRDRMFTNVNFDEIMVKVNKAVERLIGDIEW